ncbi:MAG: SMP-30/gluconolactonase/LRE family protein [Hyphomicrobiaceae bacterium]
MTRGGETVTVIDPAACFPEGPFLDDDGALYYAQFGGDCVARAKDGTVARLWEKAGSGPSAVVPFGDHLAIMAFSAGEIVLASRAGETLRVLDQDAAGRRLNGPNDAVADGRGGLYATLSGPWERAPIAGRVVHLSADHRLVEVADDLHFANGIALSGDGARLYVNESEAGRVVAFTVRPDGTLADRRLFLRLSDAGEGPDAYPDGIKLGPDGHLYIGLFNRGAIVVVDEAGRHLRTIEIDTMAAPNLCFSPDGGTLYVAAVDDTRAPPYPGRMLAVPNR